MFYAFIKGIILIFSKIFFRIHVNGIENIPKEGSCILCFNHRSLLDPPIIGVLMPRKLCFMAKEELFKAPIFGFIIKKLGVFPIKRGAADIGSVKTAIKILKAGKVLAMYPEGTRNNSGTLGKAKPGAALIATRAQAPIIPIAAVGAYKPFNKLIVNIGKPITFEQYENQKLTMNELQDISNDIMKHIQALMEVV